MRRQFVPVVVSLSLTAALGLSGCQRWNWRGHGYDDDVNSLTEHVRPESDEKKLTGFDERARDIERNLGVR